MLIMRVQFRSEGSPRLYHFQKGADRIQPRHDMSSASMSICDCNNRPREGQKLFKRRE